MNIKKVPNLLMYEVGVELIDRFGVAGTILKNAGVNLTEAGVHGFRRFLRLRRCSLLRRFFRLLWRAEPVSGEGGGGEGGEEEGQDEQGAEEEEGGRGAIKTPPLPVQSHTSELH